MLVTRYFRQRANRRQPVPQQKAEALAYVLAQPFPAWALVGPQTPTEMRTSFQALEVELTPEQVRWLNLEE